MKTNDGATPDVPAPQDAAGLRISTYLELGRLLFKSGATSQRVADSIKRLAAITGDKTPPHVLVEYDAIIIETADGKLRMDQAKGFAGIDVSTLTIISRLLKRPLEGVKDILAFRDELRKALEGVRSYPHSALLFAAAIASVGFDLLNGADLLSLWAVIPAALIVFQLRSMLVKNAFNLYFATSAAVLAGGLLSSIVARHCGSATPAVAFIAPMLFMVPGAPMINGGVDVFRNHNQIGLARVAFTFNIVAMIALGLAIAHVILPPPLAPPPTAPAAPHSLPLKMLIDGALGALAAGGLAMLNNAHRRGLAAFVLCGFLARAFRAAAMHFGADIVSATFIATVLSTIIALQVARLFFAPGYIMAVVSVLSMVPGLFAIQGLNGLFDFCAGPASPELLAMTAQSLLKALFISAALVAGVIIPILILDKNEPRI